MRLPCAVLAHQRDDDGRPSANMAISVQRRGLLAGVGETDMLQARCPGAGPRRNLARTASERRVHVVLQPEQTVGGSHRGRERASAGARPESLCCWARRIRLTSRHHRTRQHLAVHGAQDQDHDRADERKAVQDPSGRLPRGAATCGTQRLAVDLVAEAGVTGRSEPPVTPKVRSSRAGPAVETSENKSSSSRRRIG